MAKGQGAYVLVTGGAGYVAGPVVNMLVDRGLHVRIVDNLTSGHAENLPSSAELLVGDLGQASVLDRALLDGPPLSIFHFAARTEVALSMADPLTFYRVNIEQGLLFLRRVVKLGSPFVFSSSAAVYGLPKTVPIVEDAQLQPINPYGETKRTFESALSWAGQAYGLRWAALRYFNAAGAGTAAERHDPETHLIPNLLRAAAGGRQAVLYGTDYPTADGTAVRDYVHVEDLAEGHLLAMDYLLANGQSGAFNLGSGHGSSVKEVLAATEAAVGHPIPHNWTDRRAGDPAVLVADIRRATDTLRFRPSRSDIGHVAADAWKALAPYLNSSIDARLHR